MDGGAERADHPRDDRDVRRRSLHVRLELSGGRGEGELGLDLSLLQADHRRSTQTPTVASCSPTTPSHSIGSTWARSRRREELTWICICAARRRWSPVPRRASATPRPRRLAEEGVNVILVSRTQADLDAAREKIAARLQCACRGARVRYFRQPQRRSAGGATSGHRYPGEQCGGDSGRQPAGDHRGSLARRVGPEGVWLHQYVPPVLCLDAAARARRDRQRARHGG